MLMAYKEGINAQKFFSTLRAENCDIYLLHETHVPSVQEGKLWGSEWGGQAIFSPGSNRSAGVGILVNTRSPIKLVTHRSDKNGRLIAAKNANIKYSQFGFPNSQRLRAQHCVRLEGFL